VEKICYKMVYLFHDCSRGFRSLRTDGFNYNFWRFSSFSEAKLFRISVKF